MNYLYPGQDATMVEVPGHGWLPYYDAPELIPDTIRGKVAVPQLSGVWEVGQTVWSRYPTTVPGGGPILLLCLIIIIAILIIIGLYISLLMVREMQEREEVCDATLDPACGTCYSCDRRYGNCWFRWNCCTGKTTPVDPSCKNDGNGLIETLLLITAIGAGAYIGFKIILPALAERKKK